MKLKAAQKVRFEAGPNMTPLVDIVMVILIFLMLTGTFAVGEHFLQSNIPVAKKGAGGVAAPTNVPLDEPLEIQVDSYIRAGTDGATLDVWVARAGGGSPIQNSREQLVAKLTQIHEQMNKANTPTEKIQVVINPGRDTKYKHLVEVYEAAMDARFRKIAFSPAHEKKLAAK